MFLILGIYYLASVTPNVMSKPHATVFEGKAEALRRVLQHVLPKSFEKYLYITFGPYTCFANKVRELDIRGIVHCEFVATGQTVNQVYFLEVLKRLREKFRRKRQELFANSSWILHHNNAPAHTALSVR